MDFLAIFASILSILSLIIALKETLRPLKIKVFVSEFSKLLINRKGKMVFHFPITLVNTSNGTGVINRINLLMEHQKNKKLYKFIWDSFCKTQDSNWEPEGPIYPIAIEGKRYFTKVITFFSKEADLLINDLEMGTYKMIFEIFRPGDTKIHSKTQYYFELTDDILIDVGFSLPESEKWHNIDINLTDTK